MAKRKSRAKSSRNKKNNLSFGAAVFRWVVIILAVIILCLIGGLYVYNYFSSAKEQQPIAIEQPEKEQPQPKKQVKQEAPVKKKPITTAEPTTKPKKLQIPADAELPKLLKKQKEQIIRHEGYTVYYNSDYRIANWVAYQLTEQEAKSQKAERSNKFVPDPQVKGATAYNEDYTRTGYDRGHLAPAGDMKWSIKAMRESFYLSNICPQAPELNRGLWKDLEELIRLWAKDHETLMIATGPVITDEMKRMGKNRVGVPTAFFKVIGCVSDNEYQAIAFLFENRDYGNTSLKSVAITVDRLEKMVDIDFFPSLPDKQEKKMESAINWNCWSF